MGLGKSDSPIPCEKAIFGYSDVALGSILLRLWFCAKIGPEATDVSCNIFPSLKFLKRDNSFLAENTCDGRLCAGG